MELMIMENTDRKHTKKAILQVERRTKGEFTYWKKITWDESKPLAMVMANYPITMSLEGDSLTGILVRNAITDEKNYGGVIIANLFNKGLKWPSEKGLANSIAPDGIKELVDVAKSAEKIIVATGSLTTKYEAARAQLDEFISECQTANLGEKLFWLVNSSGKKVHPLAIRNEPWEFGPINKADLVVKEMKEKNE